MSILDMFRSTPQQTSQQQAPAAPAPQVPATPGNIPDQASNPAQSTQATAANGVVPVTPKDDSPLAQFNTLWDTKATDSNTPNAPAALNQADIATAVSKIDFTSFMTPDNLAAISAGGEGATQALQAALNTLAQNVLTQSTMVNNKLAEKNIADAQAALEARLPAMLRSQTAAAHLKDKNPLFSNPAVKPVIEATQAALLRQYPQATPAEITEMTNNYIVSMGAAFAPQPVINNADQADNVDWEAFMKAPI